MRTWGSYRNARAVQDVEWRVAERLVADGVDEFLLPLLTVDCLTRDSLLTIVEAHARLVTVIRPVARDRREESFSAKYLSVAYPNVVQRYDSLARQRSEILLGAWIDGTVFAGVINERYANHCHSLFLLLDALRDAGVTEPDLMLVDHVLWRRPSLLRY